MSVRFTHFSQRISTFHESPPPEEGHIVGSGAVIEALELPLPLPGRLSLISDVHRRYEKGRWQVFTPRHMPEDSLYGHLTFSLKYEGVNILFLKKLFEASGPRPIEDMVKEEPLGIYRRKIWFLYEWLTGSELEIPSLDKGNYIPLLDQKLQYALERGSNAPRQRIRNNLCGHPDFCPSIRRTKKLDTYLEQDLSGKISMLVRDLHPDILARTSAFLMLKDSKASFHIEGEAPSGTRASRWGKAIGQAGKKALSKDELERLQKIVIENPRFTAMGFRTEGGFVGEHDRLSGEPIPEHISARWQDLDLLTNGLIKTAALQRDSGFHPVLSAAMIAFGLVFIHPFEDGNGRIHRYLLHHILVNTGFSPPGIIFPVSSAILQRITRYRKILEDYSAGILEFIEWKKTPDNNVEVLNNTVDYYRYFDATIQAEFLFDCVSDTLETIIPEEVAYLENFERFKIWLDDHFEMPDKTVAMLLRFLNQNKGSLSKRARKNEFSELNDQEVSRIERLYQELFMTR